MCTVTFIPTQTGVILTSNRDEHSSRGIALYPEIYHLNDKNLIYPKDRKAGGTWFISNEYGDIGVLLNGAFTKHIPEPPYRQSRGQVLPDIFQQDSPYEALKMYTLSGIEPFTIVLWEKGILREIIWDGLQLKMRLHDKGRPHIWSSVTLYDNKMITERHGWFNTWVAKQEDITQAAILAFHNHTEMDNKEYGLLISRSNQISTTSITSVAVDEQKAQILHQDIIQNIKTSIRFDLLKDQQSLPSIRDHFDITSEN